MPSPLPPPLPDLSALSAGPFQTHVKLLLRIDEQLHTLESDELAREAKELGGGYERTSKRCDYIAYIIRRLICEQMMPVLNDANDRFLARAAEQLAATEGDEEAQQRKGQNPELDLALKRIRQTMLPVMGGDEFLKRPPDEQAAIAEGTWHLFRHLAADA